MARLTLNKIKSDYDLNILAAKKILTLGEVMVWYNLSYEKVKELINIYDMPCTNITGSLMFCKDSVDSFFSRLVN